MVKKYVFVRMWADSLKNFKIKKLKMDNDLKIMGINKKVPMTRLIHVTSSTPLDLNNAGVSLKQLTKRGRRL